ncbi:RMD1 family protein [Segetibacter koreensis]|uniref:RMD1 family protein n=1 Tax=Segetibacter koreensis TaxID=398037 RepID=UPI00036CA4AB|nr:RMD1 family protein [Segetibacter koreensis]
MQQQVISYQIADNIDVKTFKNVFKAELYHSDPSELFYKIDTDQYVYVFKYGVVCFLNCDPIKISEFLLLVSNYCKNPFSDSLSEEYQIKTNGNENKIAYKYIEIIGSDIEVLRLIMLNVSQSVALDYYSEETTKLLEETNFHTQILATKGRLGIRGLRLKKYIGTSLLLKNRIAENLYIFDSPPETWEDENLNKIDLDLKRMFDLQERSRNIHDGLNIIKDNLELFRALLQSRHSNILEWIVIILILVEVLNLFVEKLLH